MTDEELSRIRREAGRKGGLKGGKAKVPKGFAITKDAKEKSKRGVDARKRKQSLKGL